MLNNIKKYNMLTSICNMESNCKRHLTNVYKLNSHIALLGPLCLCVCIYTDWLSAAFYMGVWVSVYVYVVNVIFAGSWKPTELWRGGAIIISASRCFHRSYISTKYFLRLFPLVFLFITLASKGTDNNKQEVLSIHFFSFHWNLKMTFAKLL